jgi:hypothetical protein
MFVPLCFHQALLAKYEESCSMNLEQLSGLRAQIRQLIKFVALNYLAVVKAIKKRNRHCKVGMLDACTYDDAVHLQYQICVGSTQPV